jgi:hypothetical protein
MKLRRYIAVGSLIGVCLAGSPAHAASTPACKAEKRPLKVATFAYFAENSSYPNSAADLVPVYLRRLPKHFDVGSDGKVFVKRKGC